MGIEVTKQLNALSARLNEAWALLNLEEKREQLAKLETEMNKEGFWEDQDRAKTVTSEHADLQKEIERWEQLKADVQETRELMELLDVEPDKDAEAELADRVEELERVFRAMEVQLLFTGPYDTNDAYLSIHAGAGGVDAQDWAEMLLRMFTRYAEKQGWKVELLEISKGGEAGIKSATLYIQGRYAYGNLQSEHGIHRLVRISPFDAEAMRHTSFASVEVTPDLGDVKDVEIKDEDLRIDVFRSSGAGGQHVNVTDSAVRIVHEPSGITVTVQNERSQQQNKAKALAILKSKLALKVEEERREEEAKAKGEYKSAEWGNQIRSYVLQPYKLVKDHRTKQEDPNPDNVLDGDLQPFVEAFLRWQAQ